MPNTTGYELCDKLKQDIRTSHIPIILLTAKADLESRIEGLKFGADDYLQKPFDREELEVRIRNLIINRKKMQERYSSFDAFSPAEDELTRAEDEFILKFRSVIEDNLDSEGFGIPELCDALHLGKSQLHKKIKTLTGKTPIQYIRSIKLNEARNLLLTSANISEVAFDLGYSDPKYFARVFKDEFGLTPSDFVKQYVKK
jgi:YesN/AraC family two-component response regulator